MRTLFAIVATLTLCACASPEEIAAQQDATCANYGFNRWSDEYANCRMTLNQQSFERQQALSRMIIQNSQIQTEQQRAWSNAAAANRPTANCITNYVGNNAYTSCQ